MRPWTIIIRGTLIGGSHSLVREASLPYDKDKAWTTACERWGDLNVVAIIPGTFKNIVFNGFSETNR